MKRRILVADDIEINGQYLKRILEPDGFDVDVASAARVAYDLLRGRKYHLLITDLRMPDFSGMDLLKAVRADRLPVGVIVLTAFGEPLDALSAMKAGADDFVTKPYEPDHLRLLVNRILDRRALIDELDHLREQMRGAYHFHTMVSKSPKMRRIFDLIEQIGPSGSNVVVVGETGTGKELVAQAIHAADTRRAGPLVALNCAVFNDSLLESELFGHERGAFTGAERRKLGRFEQANRGTLLLDEVGDLSPALQAKLLRVLQTSSFERLGGTETIKVDVRLVAATNKCLEEEVKRGRFRADLYYRLNVIRIELPPLRERTEDIPLLATHFVETCRSRMGSVVSEIASDAMQALLRHRWPGNVRELENAIRAAVALADGTILRREDLPEWVAPRTADLKTRDPLLDIDRPLPDLTADLIGRIERDYLLKVLAHHNGNVARCARHSGLSRRSVTQKLQKYGLKRSQFKRRRADAMRRGAAGEAASP
jgi:DNA-binding NtrC family response regulator